MLVMPFDKQNELYVAISHCLRITAVKMKVIRECNRVYVERLKPA